MVYSQAACVFILEHYFTSKSFAAFREAFNSAYPDMEVLNKTAVHRPVIKFQDRGNVCENCLSSDKTAEIMAVPFSSSASAATTDSYVVVRVVGTYCMYLNKHLQFTSETFFDIENV
jgi:hypothetical protein